MIGESTVRMRSMHVADFPDELEVPSGVQTRGTDTESSTTTDTPDGINESGNEEGVSDPLQLPPSTHSLLFTQPIWSLPFVFALAIVATSLLCLLFVIISMTASIAAWGSSVPVNIPPTVRWAQYLSIFIILLMEEEIPTALYLLRMIPQTSFEEQFPDLCYTRFIISSLVRLVIGYFFLLIVFVVLAQATGVIEIFYDVLALQFIQQLDDIAFALAKMDVLGKEIKLACTAKCFRTELTRKKIGGNKKLSICLKAIYLLNCGLLLGGMAVISTHQIQGIYQSNSITVDFGNRIWERAWVKMPAKFYKKWIRLYPFYGDIVTPGKHEEWTLVFSYFNGVYKKNGMHANRPVYTEMSKTNSSLDYNHMVPAKIFYCKGISAWVFAHEYIQKSKAADEVGCNWLLRSEETKEYDLMNVGMSWKIWYGVIGNTEVSYADDECSDDTECNLNGKCIDGQCRCTNGDGVEYLGTHCEISFEDECQTVVGESDNMILTSLRYTAAGSSNGTLDSFRFNSSEYNVAGNLNITLGALVQQYSRPIYFYVSSDLADVGEDDLFWFIYAGNRWFGVHVTLAFLSNFQLVSAQELRLERHAFWSRVYDPLFTKYISDQTEKGTPVGVDFYKIEEHGGQFGPFGALNPIQIRKQTGRGFFRCHGPVSSLVNTSVTDRKLQLQTQRGSKPV